MGVKHYLRVFQAYVMLHIKQAMEYRLNFFMQATFMLLNDFLWILIWYFIFSALQTINGYQLNDVLLIVGISAMAYGFVSFFFGNRRNVPDDVVEGKLDFFLSLPIDEIFHLMVSKSEFSGVGDIVFGFLILYFITPSAILQGTLFAGIGAVIILGFGILVNSLSFWLEKPKFATNSLHELSLAYSSWPIDVYQAPIKAILYLLPAAYIATVPSHLIKAFTWTEFIILIIVAIAVLAIGIFVFRIGLKKYESGNIIAMRG